jgi:hypothetical protein
MENKESKVIYNLSTIPGFNELVETGKLEQQIYYTKKNYYTNKSDYVIVKYNKNLPPELYNTYGLLRSVVLTGKKVVAFAPPKSMVAEKFIIKYPEKTTEIIAEEFVEGTMVNLFFDCNCEEWEISTKNTVGGNVTFYDNSKKTFREMFNEACVHNNLYINNLNKKYCYSFVLQHPDNKIVAPIFHPQLYLIAVYEIVQNNDYIFVIEENIMNFEIYDFFDITSTLKYSTKYTFKNYTELIESYSSEYTPYNVMGVVVKNLVTGDRSKIRNPIYEKVKELRGNQPKLQYQYYVLRQNKKIIEFLKYYPEFKEKFDEFYTEVNQFIKTLHIHYLSFIVKKSLKEISKEYKTHIFKLHYHYINNLKSENLRITHDEVTKYVNELHPRLLMHSINFSKY